MTIHHRTPFLLHSLAIAVIVTLAGCSSSDGDGGATGDGDTINDDDMPGDGDGDMPGGDGDGDGDGEDDTVTVTLGDVSGNVIDFGYVEIEQPGDGGDPFAEEGGITGSFLRFQAAFPALTAIEGFQPPLDTCTVETFTLGSEAPGDFDFDFDFELQSLSAGQQLIFTGSGGTYVELPREQAFGLTFYQVDGEALPGPVPGDLVLDIPGDDFAAFASVAVPNVAPLTGVTPASRSITADTVFGWDAGDNPDAYISISSSSTSFAGEGISLTSVDCLAVDDGEFAFPAQTRAELGAFMSSSADVARIGLRILRRGNTLLLVSNRSGG